MPNIIAYLALASWPIVAFVLYRRLPEAQAFVWTILAGYLLLPPAPAGFAIPGLVFLTKEAIAPLSAFAARWIVHGRSKHGILPRSTLLRWLIYLYVFSPILTLLTNLSPIFFGDIVVNGMHPKEVVGLIVTKVITLLPFLLTRQVIREGDGQREFLKAVLIAGLLYSLLMLIEVRLSPQMNLWVYGFFQHNFGQMVRGDGFRPIVFLYHGLWTAFFAMMALYAAAVLFRLGAPEHRLKYAVAMVYMAVVLVLCKSLGSLLFAMFLVPLVLLTPAGFQMRLATIIIGMVLLYPVYRLTGLLAGDGLVALASEISSERAQSLEFRFANENVLLTRAMERPLFGWGTWGRNHLFDPETGRIMTVTDGQWVLTLGVFGWIGYLAEFGLLAAAFLQARQRVLTRGGATTWVAPMSLLFAINMIDLIPNATLTPMTWMIAGMLAGWGGRGKLRKPEPEKWQTVL